MRFIVFGDSKGKENGINKKILNSILNESSRLNPKPDFVIVLGDSIAGGDNPNILLTQINDFRNIVASYYPNKPLIPIVGNHEVNINPSDETLEQLFSKCYADLKVTNYLEGYNKTVYYMDFPECRLIVLNSFHYGEIHRITNNQLKWFKESCAENNKRKLVFVHSAAFPTGAHLGHCLDLYPKYRDEFWSIVDEYNIKVVFSSHEHNYSRRIINNKNSIYQIISGGGGEKLKNKYSSKSGVIIPPIAVYHFVVVDLNSTFIKISAINLKGKVLDEFII